jgi:hypothetical protein
MNQKHIISTAVMVLLMCTALPSFAQRGEGEKGGGGGGQAQHQAQPQHSQPAQRQAQPERTQQTQRQAQPQRVQQTQQTQRQVQPQRVQQTQQTQRQPQQQRVQQTQQTQRQPQQQHSQQGYGRQGVQTSSASRGGGGQYGRISNASYGSHFGNGHSFRMGRPQMIGGYNRFQYGGYWFGYNQAWPMGWGYDDDVYVVYEDGGYYMYNMRHPGVHFSLNIF